MEFANKVVLITGASSGIGAATAVRFSRLGASVVLVARNADNLASVVALCKGPIKPLTIVADVCKETERIINDTIKHFGKLDVLVNNAGKGSFGGIESTNVEQLDDLMELNVRAVYALTVLAVPHLLKTKGNIVNVSSVAGLRSTKGALAYSMTKSALDQFTKCVALDLAPKGVRVNSVNPAVIKTNFLTNLGLQDEQQSEFLEKQSGTHPLGRVGTSEEVADGIAFLASDRATFVTGTLLAIDGGRASS